MHPPDLGENSAQILTELGYDDDAISALLEAGVITRSQMEEVG